MNAPFAQACGFLVAAGLSASAMAGELRQPDPELVIAAPTTRAAPATTAPAPVVLAEGVLEGRLYIAPMLSYLLADKSRNTDDGLGGRLTVGEGITDNLALELTGYYLQADAKDGGATAKLYGAGASLLFFPRNSFPNAYAIATATYNQAKDHPGIDGQTHRQYGSPGFEAGLGYLLPLSWHKATLRLEAKFRVDVAGDRSIGAGGKNQFYDDLFNVGLSIPLEKTPPPVAPPPTPPAEVVPVEQPDATEAK